MRPTFSSWRCFALLPAAVLVALQILGCGAAAGGMKAADQAPNEPASPAAELDAAESQINALFTENEVVAVASAAPVSRASPPFPSESPGAPATQSTAGGGEASADPCAVACRALASMERAANHICDLSGAADVSCEKARSRVKVATDRVAAHCACR